MAESYLIYLDVCCLNRPFDDWRQDRIRLEGQTILDIFQRFYSEEWKLVSSEAIEAELNRMVNLDKLDRIRKLLRVAENKIILTDEIDKRSQEIEKLGFGLYDSFHIACAETAKVDVLLTTDDRLLKKAIKYSHLLKVKLDNPVTWLMNTFVLKGNNNNDTN
ncbi:MAG: PIN domain-containing protein [Moorea sp. SIO1F2]|uniref:PIN domain-containing protein n=1 Tax=unclassified Moorena TaxID=2683338 RepID=UPI0013BB7B5A|nr:MULTISPECIES: PIN domain-containing protein [unclassified Moorena]NEN94088.1 PIN domain-containing protein [Moorena sp. SIO3I7]NEO05313.1 PIN domain-containing protein [Moorena sp. SIO3I8]NEP24230.1 PIN domain-containing protein [Moorena sp. SIO3I6]NET85001.1 PIN domain-containing protein [Moorena sp. SIO1F2]